MKYSFYENIIDYVGMLQQIMLLLEMAISLLLQMDAMLRYKVI